MIHEDAVRSIFKALHAASEDLPEHCYISITLPSHSITHRFAIQKSALGHIESHDHDSICILPETEQQNIRASADTIQGLQNRQIILRSAE